MTNDAQTLYKLIILYMLSRVDFPLTRAQITDFILEKEYTNYMNIQTTIAQLSESKMIIEKTFRNRTQLFLTEEGKSTLQFFENRISYEIKKDIDLYFKNRKIELRDEVSVTGDYQKQSDHNYSVHLCAKERGQSLIDLSLCVPTEEIAVTVCQKWEKKNQEIYQFIVEQLF